MTPYYYIIRPGSSAPKVKHHSLRSAVTEAERLAKQHPGVAFEIAKVIAITQTTQVSTFWMDGEEPV